MTNFCVANGEKCPGCKGELEQAHGKCKNCSANIRFININRIRNKNFLRAITKYDMVRLLRGWQNAK